MSIAKFFLILTVCLNISLFAESPSLHVLITTIGRSSLIHMLNSLGNQLTSDDYLTVVFDAKDKGKVYNETLDLVGTFSCKSTVIMEKVNLGFWGHAIRNKYNILPGDFILHGDDDDIYTEGAMDMIRRTCTDFSTLYIFKMRCKDGLVLWLKQDIALGEIGTPMGVIPSYYNSLGKWVYRYGGDFFFYRSIEKIIPNIEFVDHVIYQIRPCQGSIPE